MIIKNVFVSPGEKLGVIEEYIPGKGTYVENGNIYSSITGELYRDLARREIHINPKTHQLLIPRQGDIVVGKVKNVQEKNLILDILQIGNTQLPNAFTGIMHISDVSSIYIKTTNDAFKVGDIVLAKVISTKNREFHLSTRSAKMGVIQAFCVECGNLLVRQKKHLRCARCNKLDKRKIAEDYGERHSHH